jgi:hypothetical protein
MASVKEINSLTITVDSTGISADYMRKVLSEAEDVAEEQGTSTASVISLALEAYIKEHNKE